MRDKITISAFAVCAVGIAIILAMLQDARNENRKILEQNADLAEMLREIRLLPAISPMRRGVTWRTLSGDQQTVEMSCGVDQDVELFLRKFRDRVDAEQKMHPPIRER